MNAEQPCIFCLIGQGKIQSAKVYEDTEITAFLDIKPATDGHVQIISKTHAPLINMLPLEVKAKMFNIALSIGGNLVQKLKATGVTYLINEGAGAGQRVPHASIQVIPRYDGDSVTIGFEEKELSQEDVNNYLKMIISKLQEESPVEEPAVVEEPVVEEMPEEDIMEEVEERVPKYW